MKVLFAIGAMLGLSYMVADKSKIDEYSRELTRKVRTPCLVIVGVTILLFML